MGLKLCVGGAGDKRDRRLVDCRFHARSPSVAAALARAEGPPRGAPLRPQPRADNRRDLYIYVPAAPARGDSRYPVIYMQDGQNLFDPAQSFAGTWGVDETLS